MEDAYRAALACLPDMNVLSLPRLLSIVQGAEKLWNILEHGGGRAAALVGSERAEAWREACRRTNPAKRLEELLRQGIKVIIPCEHGFPERLCETYDPPALLFAMGEVPPEDCPWVAVVGSRKASNYGKWAAERIGEELARRGIAVISGAAYGVDGHAHLGCLKAGGLTVAVLGCGIDRIYPPGHARLLERIVAQGCVLSEYPPGCDPLPWRFPHRNRIIAGIAHAVVVVEASERSGALITANFAIEEGREVLAVPGPITSALSQGTNALIQKGAKLVSCVEDICEELPPDVLKRINVSKDKTNGDAAEQSGHIDAAELEIIELLQGGPRGLDTMAVELQEPPGELLSRLTEMTFKGWVTEEAGGRYRLLENPCLRTK
jgi:DNA processing protein